MSKKPPFAMLIELAQKEVDEAAATLGSLQRRRDEMLGKGTHLDGYRCEYESKLASAVREGMTMLERRNFDAFLGTLGTAIDQQHAQVASLDTTIEAARQLWQVKKRKLSSFETLDKRAKQVQAAQDSRRDQLQTDEFASRRARERDLPA